jgi:polysaccharide deacetylase 2 family uncharacterized protein YibQ
VNPLFGRILPHIRRIAVDYQTIAAAFGGFLAKKAVEFVPRLRRAGDVTAARLRAGAGWSRVRLHDAHSSILQIWSMMARGCGSFLRHARMWAAGILMVGRRDVELPRLGIAPLFQMVAALFAIVAVMAAVFTGWQVLRGGPDMQKSSVVAVRDHHPPLAGAGTSVWALADDADSAVVNLPVGPEEGGARVPSRIALAGDIDAKNWFDITAAPEAEEKLAVAFPPLPRAEKRPEPPLAAGIPIQPEPPFGTAPADPPWLANAVQVRHIGKRPMIAIVIDDAGVAQAHTRRAIQLPAPLTFAFIPYSRDLERQARYAHSRGHELLLHIPMEPTSAEADPGYNALLTSLSRDEIMRRFRWALSRFDGYVGVNNHMGSKFMARSDLVRPILQEIESRGLLFLDSRTDHTTVGGKLAEDMGMPHASRNVFLDNELDPGKIRRQLAELEKVARERGEAIAIGHPHDVTIDVLARWIPQARRKGFQLVPVSAIVKKDYDLRLASAAAGGESNRLLGGAQ